MLKYLLEHFNYENNYIKIIIMKNQAKQDPLIHFGLEVGMGCDRGTGDNHRFGKQGFLFVSRHSASLGFPCCVSLSKSFNFSEPQTGHL